MRNSSPGSIRYIHLLEVLPSTVIQNCVFFNCVYKIYFEGPCVIACSHFFLFWREVLSQTQEFVPAHLSERCVPTLYEREVTSRVTSFVLEYSLISVRARNAEKIVWC